MRSKPLWILYAILTPNTTLKMEWQARKGRERQKESSEFYVRNLEKMWCGLVKASSKWESNMKVNSSWLSNKSTSGGGTRPEKDPARPSKSPNPMVRIMKISVTMLVPTSTMRTVKWSFPSKMNSEDTAVDSESTHPRRVKPRKLR